MGKEGRAPLVLGAAAGAQGPGAAAEDNTMWLASWLKTLVLNFAFIAGVSMIIAFVIEVGPALLVPPGAALAVLGARGLRRIALAD